MDKFDCEEEVSFSYHSSHVALLGRALQQSIKICLQIESTGFMCIQVMMPVPEGLTMGQHSGILEFKVGAGYGTTCQWNFVADVRCMRWRRMTCKAARL